MEITLVIPGRNSASTIRQCLDSVIPLLGKNGLTEVIFVDDGSTDDTASIVATYPIRLITGTGSGPGSARNIGFKAACTPLIWFMDSDCTARSDTLEVLKKHLDEEGVSAAGGSYENMLPDSTLACLIQEEIHARHRRMPANVNFLATFNMLVRRDTLEEIGGFAEEFLKAQDAELSYRIIQQGGRLKFDIRSKVGHFHPASIRQYLNTQKNQGYWRVRLYLNHPVRISGDSYSNIFDLLQPPVSVLSILFLLLSVYNRDFLALFVMSLAFVLFAKTGMALEILNRRREPKYLLFPLLSAVRSYARAWGMIRGVFSAVYDRLMCGMRESQA